MRIEQTILNNLVFDEEYSRTVLPFLNKRYFSERQESILFEEINKFFIEYNKCITPEILSIEVIKRKDISGGEEKEIEGLLSSISKSDTNKEWLLHETEAFCKKKAVYNAILDSIGIIEGRDKTFQEDAIPSLLSDALAVSFDTNVGHSYIDDSDSRFEFYHRVEEKVKFDLDIFNKITKGGLSNKTLNIILAGTGVGKSLAMCHFASGNLLDNKNVLYITMEMAEERIAERIDANLLNLSMEELSVVDKAIFDSRLDKIKKKSRGKLIIKEYPTAGAHAGHFRALLEELKMKQDFAPDVIYIDYLNICASQRLRANANANSYTLVKSIAEELRGLAVEYNVPIVSATQVTRSGFNSSDVELTDTSESFGLPATADLMFALISTEELENLGQLMVKQLKNRYADPSYYKRFVIGIDRSKMKLYDLEESAQQNIHDSGQPADDKPLFDKSNFGSRLQTEGFKF
jgi:replicative DNA helicase